MLTKKTDTTITWDITRSASYLSEDTYNTGEGITATSMAGSSITSFYMTDASKASTASVATSSFDLSSSGAYAMAALGAGLALLAAF